jgi:hypothetical protein
MSASTSRWRIGPAAALVLAAAAAGCTQRTREDYIPSAELARSALIQAMDAWKRGEPPGRIEGKPAVQVGDTRRRTGQKLVRYEVLGELPSEEGRLFAVRVHFENPIAEEKANYLVVGIDPLWVFRQEDYQMVTHWEHNMPDSSAQPAKKP